MPSRASSRWAAAWGDFASRAVTTWLCWARTEAVPGCSKMVRARGGHPRLAGRFTDHHALLCRLHLDRIAVFGTAVAGLEGQIAAKAAPWQRELDLLKTIPGFADAVAQAWLAEIGPAPHLHFPGHDKLASWVTSCPGSNISARKRKHGRTGDAGTYIKPMLIQAAWPAIRAQGRMQARYPRLVRRFGGTRTRPRRRRRSPRSRTPC